MIRCPMCDKTWPEYNRANVVIHYRDDHQGNLMFLSDKDVRMMVDETKR